MVALLFGVGFKCRQSFAKFLQVVIALTEAAGQLSYFDCFGKEAFALVDAHEDEERPDTYEGALSLGIFELDRFGGCFDQIDVGPAQSLYICQCMWFVTIPERSNHVLQREVVVARLAGKL